MRGGGLSARMVRHYLYALRLFYNHLEQSGQLKNNPMSAYPLPVVQANRRNILSLSEIARLYEVCERVEDRAMLHIYYGLGLRRSEGESLKMGDMDEAKSLIYVRSGKGGKMRAVPMNTRIREDLAQYKMSKVSNKDAPFLSNAKGRPLRGNAAGRRLKKLLEMADLSLEYSLHSLRHSIASHLLLSGLKMEEVRRFLGHNNLESTQIYLHHGLEELA
jgi:integrase/recombinase XerD